jgi:hypothetical protein
MSKILCSGFVGGGGVVPPVPPGYDDDIIFNTLYASAATFAIPTCGTKNGVNCEYNWTVYIDGEEQGTYTGTSSGDSTGIVTKSLSAVTHTITIKPADGLYSAGWGAAFGFWSGTTNVNTEINKGKLTGVIQDPDWAHMYTATDTGDNFRYNQFCECNSLTVAVPETLPNTVTRIGDSFHAYQYYTTTISKASLSIAANEYIPDSVTSIGDNFRAYQYHSQRALTAAANESLPDSVMSIGAGFRMYQYYCNSNGSGTKPNFRTGSHIHSKQFVDLLNANGTNYSYMFHETAVSGFEDKTADTMPLYYLDDGITTAPVTDLTPDVVKKYVTGRTGISGYTGLKNWK